MAAGWTECDIHLVPFEHQTGCRYCLRFLEDAPEAGDLPMTIRLTELEQWLSARRSVPEELFYRRIEALVGRSISLHELDDPDLLLRRAQQPRRNWDYWSDW